MRKEIGKHIVTIHPDYLKFLHKANGCRTSEEEDQIFRELTHTISAFLKGEGDGRALFMAKRGCNGKYISPITFSPIPNLAYMNRLLGRGKNIRKRRR